VTSHFAAAADAAAVCSMGGRYGAPYIKCGGGGFEALEGGCSTTPGECMCLGGEEGGGGAPLSLHLLSDSD
jgi:hypothetical protein